MVINYINKTHSLYSSKINIHTNHGIINYFIIAQFENINVENKENIINVIKPYFTLFFLLVIIAKLYRKSK